MKVILLKDVAKIGRRFDVVEVTSGYGMNKLIPQGIAKPATPENLKMIQSQSEKTKSSQVAEDEIFELLLNKIDDVPVEISVEANKEGRMFQALKIETVAEALQALTGQDVSSAQIVIKAPIKDIGEHTIDLVSGSNSKIVKIILITK